MAPGTYTGTGEWVINLLGKPITIRATGTPEETIIDGEGQRRVVYCSSGEDADTVIDGFTITGGISFEFDANGNGKIDWWENDGGGIYCFNSNPTITRIK